MSQAAYNGLPDAQMGLGTLYFEGKAISQDYQKAYMWYYISYKNGNKNGKDALKQVIPFLNSKQVSEAKKMGNDWIKNHKAIDTELTSVKNGVTIPVN